MKMQIEPGMNIPITYPSNKSRQSLLDFIDKHQKEIIQQLYQYGAFLVRGFPCQDAEFFSQAIALCNLGNRCSTKDYEIARTVFDSGVYTSSDLPGSMNISLHHEKPRSKKPPDHLYFYCMTPAQKGGATLFANAEAIWVDIPQSIQEKLREHGVVYKQFFHGKTLKYSVLKKLLNKSIVRTWSEYFSTNETIDIEKKLTEDQLKWQWINDNLVVLNPLPGVLPHPTTQQPLWFNAANYLNYYSNALNHFKRAAFYQSLAARYIIAKDILPMVCHYGNGEAFSYEEINIINQVLQKHTQTLKWQSGDFMIMDNYTWMHGKEPHQGNRLLYSCMTEITPITTPSLSATLSS